MALPDERVEAVFTEDSRLELTPEQVGACRIRMEGIVGEGVDMNVDVLAVCRIDSTQISDSWLESRDVELHSVQS